MRDARNSRAFQAWVRDETGWDVEMISGLEEGRLIHRGVVENEPGAGGRCVLVDLGGGSCEITLSEHKRMRETISLPLGAVRLTQEFVRSEVPEKEEVARLRQFIDRELRKARRRIHPDGVRLVIGTSGTAAALADAGRAWSKRRGGKARAERRSWFPAETVRRLAAKLTKMKNARAGGGAGDWAAALGDYRGGRARVCGNAGGVRAAGFRYSPLGLRDGILAQMLAEQDSRASVHRSSSASAGRRSRRRAGATASIRGRRSRCGSMRRSCFAIWRQCHELPPEYRTWLEAAAMLRDIGKFLNHQGYHRHAQYIIANSELYGFTPQQRVVTSAIARYLGKSRPAPEGRTMRQVPPEEYEHVRRAVVLLRLAVALNQDRASDVLKVRVRVYPKRVLMELLPGRTGAELELWSLRKEADYFREVFGRDSLWLWRRCRAGCGDRRASAACRAGGCSRRGRRRLCAAGC